MMWTWIQRLFAGEPDPQNPPPAAPPKQRQPMRLSDHIRVLDAEWSEEHYRAFLADFLNAEVGITIQGQPEGVERIVTSEEHNITVGQTDFPDGRKRLLLYADPAAFADRFGQRFNAGISGRDACRILLANPDLEGVLINSADVVLSYPIPRGILEQAYRVTMVH